ncbi:hypothetical protein Desaci_1390 [Desulfosporosinus acidiphilus SJ4]|uniref:Uncharacterized protein n=1 Tax=Desulfosporosinus acidiphilus (strain DSM 22704 / JCM 16185 / SJ4) TaxID=646529 RepID=I4D3N9_DESAJ|nr:hypothetical protein [Desulfosporosinus acidiphilus]AFM40413.1 hypothetical protein Desaci_1390 [Desulfosporosinus acidiphilus SJ4]
MKKFLSFAFLSLVILILSVSPVYATSMWDYNINGQQIPISFTEYFDAPDGSSYGVTYPLSVNGCWQECWDGTPYGEAYLGTLYLGGEVDYNPDNADVTVTPDVTYNYSNTYRISTPQSWTLHSSGQLYDEGYSNPWAEYNTASVYTEGHVNFYSDGYSPNSQDIYYDWTSHN